MKKIVMGLSFVALVVGSLSSFAVSSGEWEKWQITVQGNTTQPRKFILVELCHIKKYLSGYQTGLNDYISDLKKYDKNSTQAQLLGQLQSFFASLTKKEKEKFQKEIVVPTIKMINPKADCL